MSVPVELDDLQAATEGYGWAYLLTVRDDLRPHIVAVTPVWEAGSMTMSVGRGTAANVAARPSISLCYPPLEADGYSLIIDGMSQSVDGAVHLTPTGAVLHRPAAPGAGGPTDCAPVTSS